MIFCSCSQWVLQVVEREVTVGHGKEKAVQVQHQEETGGSVRETNTKRRTLGRNRIQGSGGK